MKKIILPFFVATFAAILCLASLGIPASVAGHENYVLTKDQINADLQHTGLNVFTALKKAGNVTTAATVGIISALGVLFYFLFQVSRTGQAFNEKIKKLEPFGHVLLRTALGVSLLASAHYNSFLGPEIPLSSLPFEIGIKAALYILGTLTIIGAWSEIVGAVSLLILLLVTWVYREYMLTYFNYFGEFIALLIFGSRVFSVDKLLYKTKNWIEKYKDWEIAIIRVTYGISVMYPAIDYKLLHPQVIIDIVQRYNLTQFHWLFPHDPLLIALGTGLAQVVVGLFLIIGFETRLSTLITFILMTMSVVFFKEAVWPHYILLALALYLIINNGGRWSIDTILLKWANRHADPVQKS